MAEGRFDKQHRGVEREDRCVGRRELADQRALRGVAFAAEDLTHDQLALLFAAAAARDKVGEAPGDEAGHEEGAAFVGVDVAAQRGNDVGQVHRADVLDAVGGLYLDWPRAAASDSVVIVQQRSSLASARICSADFKHRQLFRRSAGIVREGARTAELYGKLEMNGPDQPANEPQSTEPSKDAAEAPASHETLPPLTIDRERRDALNAVVEEAGFRFVAIDGNDLIFEVQRRTELRKPLQEVAETARQLLLDTQEPIVQALLAEGAARHMRLLFY